MFIQMGNNESTSAPTINEKKLENDIEISWKSFKKCPFAPREGQCCTTIQNTLYIFGGVICKLSQDESGQTVVINYETNELLKYDCDKNNWEIIESSGDIPGSRSGSTLSAVNDKLYLFGGLSENRGWVDDFYEFDIKSSKWTKIEDYSGDAPSPRDKLSSSLIGTDVYYFGGFGPQQQSDQLEAIMEDDDNEEYEDLEIQEIQQEQQSANFTWFNDVYKYNTLSKEWAYIEPQSSKPSPRAAHSMCAVKSQLVVFGGRDNVGRTNDIWVFDPATATWSPVNPTGMKPEARSFHTAISINDRVVVIGGRGVTNDHYQDFHIYDTKENQWLQPTVLGDAIPPAVGLHCLAVTEQYVILCFGASDIDPVTNSCTKYYQDTFAVNIDDILTGGAKVVEPKKEAAEDDQPNEAAQLPDILGLRQKKPATNGEAKPEPVGST